MSEEKKQQSVKYEANVQAPALIEGIKGKLTALVFKSFVCD